MQVCHGKAAPLRRIRPDDLVAYYSPTEIFGARKPFRAFTAVGVVLDREPYQIDMGGGFRPCRRDVKWHIAAETPIATLLELLEFAAGKRNWGYQLRFGLLEISAHDMNIIRTAMIERAAINPIIFATPENATSQVNGPAIVTRFCL